MNKKVLLFILLQVFALSANAAIDVMYSGGDTELDLTAPVDIDAANVTGDTVGESLAGIELDLMLNGGLPASNVDATFSINPNPGGFSGLTLDFFDLNNLAAGSLLTLTQAQIAVPGFVQNLGILGGGSSFVIRLGGTVTAGLADFDIRVSTPSASAVPVPAAVWLFGSALVGLVTVGRRRGTKLVS